MKDIIGTERDVKAPTWTSRRLLLRADGLGYSLHDTVMQAGTATTMWYRNHVESVYCIEGEGEIESLDDHAVHPLRPGTLYVLDVPGLEVRVPVEVLALEPRLEVDPGLVDVDLAAEDLFRGAAQPLVVRELLPRTAAVDGEDGADGVTFRFVDDLRVGGGARRLQGGVQFRLQMPHLGGVQVPLQHQEAILGIRRQLFVGQRAAGAPRRLSVQHRVAPPGDGRPFRHARRIQVHLGRLHCFHSLFQSAIRG